MKIEGAERIKNECKWIQKQSKIVFSLQEVRKLISLSSSYKDIFRKQLTDKKKLTILMHVLLKCTAYQERATAIEVDLRKLRSKIEVLNGKLKREYNKDSNFVRLKKKEQVSILDAQLGPYLTLETSLKRKIELMERVIDTLKEAGYSIRTVISTLKVRHDSN